MELVTLKLAQIKPYNKNPRRNDHAVDDLVQSIKDCEYIAPIVVDEDYIVLAGHTRLKALKRLKYKEAAVVVKTGLTDDQKRKYRILDNKTAEGAEWNLDLLAEECAGLDWDNYSFDFEFGDDEQAEIIEDEAPEADEEGEPTAKPGDIWQLGRHRLLVGDSTDSRQIEKLMNGDKADLVFVDPPYGMKKEGDGVENDNLNYDDLLDFNRRWIPITFDNLKDNGSWYCWGTDEPLMDIYSHILKPMAQENKITFRNLLTWNKGNGQGQMSEDFRMYPVADEKCLFVQVGIQGLTLNASQYWEEYEPIREYLYNQRILCGWDIPQMKTIAGHSDKSRDHWTSKSQWSLPTEEVYTKFKKWANDNKIEAFEKPYEQLRAEYEKLRAYFNNTHDNMNNVWHFDRTSSEERQHAGGHATPKPIALCGRAIKSSSREGEIVLDVFGGSGSTLASCEQLNRICYTCELLPRWADVIIKRWESMTGETAVLVENTLN